MLFSDYHLAKLNPKCHMNYSIIFTEISFSPETSNLDMSDRKVEKTKQENSSEKEPDGHEESEKPMTEK